MHQRIIMVVAADLKRTGHGVEAGPETELVCKEAAAIAHDYPEAIVFATAGMSKEYGVIMGEGPMRETLLGRFVEEYRIRTPVAKTFSTDGEMQALVKAIPWNRIMVLDLHLVCRSWHLPRAWLLLRANLSREQREKVVVIPVPVKNSEDHRGMWLEGLAYLKNLPKLLKAF